MPRKLRTWYPSATYHIMERGIHRQNIFSDDFDYQVFLTLLANALQKYGCILYAYCLMTNHFLIRKRPFRTPHHNISLNALIGGGANAMPGEVSLAHNGVLFLDELAEYSRRTLDALRQPVEDKKVSIFRVNGTHTFPSSFMFIAAMNPCPCGYYSSSKYRCTDYEIIKYRGKARNTPVQVYVSKTEPNHQCMVRPAFCDIADFQERDADHCGLCV